MHWNFSVGSRAFLYFFDTCTTVQYKFASKKVKILILFVFHTKKALSWLIFSPEKIACIIWKLYILRIYWGKQKRSEHHLVSQSSHDSAIGSWMIYQYFNSVNGAKWWVHQLAQCLSFIWRITNRYWWGRQGPATHLPK